jgi:RsiW-degrading membrane proteinase PrsW (M82 family)
MKRNEGDTNRLTWNKVAAFVLVTLLASMFLGIGLASKRIYLTPSLFRFTSLFYAGLGLVPALIVLVIYVTKHPAGNRLWLLILPLLGGLIFCFYLVLIGPAFFSEIKCQPTAHSGLIVHYDCICTTANSSDAESVKCPLDGLRISPFVQLDFGR